MRRNAWKESVVRASGYFVVANAFVDVDVFFNSRTFSYPPFFLLFFFCKDFQSIVRVQIIDFHGVMKCHFVLPVNWIDPSKTLREQGIDESETVLLRRKFFFSDQNIDSRDPVQLSLLYVQARDAILDGTHPVTQEKACIFAGIQCQIQFGDHKEDKHKPGFLE